eukprot:scaffold459681_cov14-Prasinocladus_malaysianus.AAC.1
MARTYILIGPKTSHIASGMDSQSKVRVRRYDPTPRCNSHKSYRVSAGIQQNGHPDKRGYGLHALHD